VSKAASTLDPDTPLTSENAVVCDYLAVVTEQVGLFAHGLDFPTPAKDAFTDAQLSMLPPTMRSRVKVHFCGPTGANAVDAAVKLCKTATGRGDLISFQGGFYGTTHTGMALSGLVTTKALVHNGVPGIHFFPYSSCSRCPVDLTPETCTTNCVTYLERSLQDPNGGYRYRLRAHGYLVRLRAV
jgi:diaminobutyrate-2-oxoglutarate transaminase